MKKFAILAVVAVMLVGVLAGCRNTAGNETSVPTTAQTVPTTTHMPQTTHPTTHATVPSTTDNIITEASEAIDDIIGDVTGTAPTDGTVSGRNRSNRMR